MTNLDSKAAPGSAKKVRLSSSIARETGSGKCDNSRALYGFAGQRTASTCSIHPLPKRASAWFNRADTTSRAWSARPFTHRKNRGRHDWRDLAREAGSVEREFAFDRGVVACEGRMMISGDRPHRGVGATGAHRSDRL